MSTSMKKAKAPKVPAKAARKVALQAVAPTSKPKTGGRAAEPAGKRKAPTAPLEVAAKPVARKAPPAGKARSKTAPAGLKLVKPAPKAGAFGSTSVAAPRPLNDKVRIFQIYYRPEQLNDLDPAFDPYDNEGDDSPLLEFNVFRKLARSASVKGADLWGALSWKFGEKTGLSGEQLRQVIAANPGYDVYYCNPFPELEGLYHNLWLQGETSHPNFLILCHEFFDAAGLPEEAINTLQPSSAFAASNYFVATPAFWRSYMSFVDHAIEEADRRMSSTAKAMIYSSAADHRGMHAAASYLPFIVERLFSVFLTRAGANFTAFKVPLKARDEKLNVHQQLLRQMKDAAVSSRSLWLATCWINYRNLYLSQFHGRDWCQRYLKSITPTSLQLDDVAVAAAGKK